MKKAVALLLASVLTLLTLIGCTAGNSIDAKNAVYKKTVYERSETSHYNLTFLEDHATYIGDFIETYDNGYEIPWKVYVLNDEENILFSSHAVWVRPGYVVPSEYGEAFTSAEYVVSEGILDTYKEAVTPLITFDGTVTLEDLIEQTPTEVSDACVPHDTVRLRYRNHADIAVDLTLCSLDGQYYLSVQSNETGAATLYRIRSEYVDILTAAVSKAK